ncbi:Putative pyruvyl transferase EpsI [Sporomusa ovata DSM 2662]|uniref:COG5039: Exopolysaccharide biosynthesis protein n=1 Tax=Sporomusa ovata TaxID=2378 RepID=A0A0U1L4T2_9FIRM|nr:polysaccharide pyruvyl transferase family protein [Sporomusa ovata]EQB28393.1 putative pyruvyl transferase EpsI [Sporomusa ovata DSM 2662]CQR74717.1 COG5039: Exopolysaccharide biosynthesis protein [Sporomusa ovata]
MINKLKKLIPISIKYYISFLLSSNRNDFFELNKEHKKVIVTLAADYGNLGDVAITYAQTKFLQRMYPEHKLIELPISKTFTKIKALKSVCGKEDIITIVGGGNMGDLYTQIEFCRRFIIKQFPGNKIISFPQTIDFSKTDYGQQRLQETIKTYSAHKKLILIAREQISFEAMKRYFPQNIILFAPDMVMSLDETEPQFERHGILLCLRNDKEKFIDAFDAKQLTKKLSSIFGDVCNYDTHTGMANMSVYERRLELEKIWDTFKKSKVVVTDRLHGMIFCYITKTPCIVFPNNNHKIKASFEWIKDCKYIKLCEKFEINMILQYIIEMSELDQSSIDKPDLGLYFEHIAREF